METVRPLQLFLGVNGPSAFCFSPTAYATPTRHLDKTTPEKVSHRLSVNFSFFLSNYALLTAGVGIVVSLLNPGMLFSVGLLWSLWWLHQRTITLGKDIPKLMGKDINEIITVESRSTLLKILTILVIIFECLGPFLSMVFISGFLVLVHAFLRDPKDVMASKYGSAAYARSRADSEDEDAEIGGAGSDSTDDESRVMVDRKDALMR